MFASLGSTSELAYYFQHSRADNISRLVGDVIRCHANFDREFQRSNRKFKSTFVVGGGARPLSNTLSVPAKWHNSVL